MRPTLADIARQSGVSAATVDRVMNGRAGVRERTRAHVMATAQKLGYFGPDGALPPQSMQQVRLHFLLPEGTNAFIRELADQVKKQTPGMDALEATVETIRGFDPPSLAARLTELRGTTDGICLVALDHPIVREAIRGLEETGTHVITLASDIRNVPRLAYIGIDNGQAGRLAGFVMGRFVGRNGPANVAFFAGSLAYRGHQEREMGFRQILTEEFPAFKIVAQHEVHDNRDRAYVETAALLDQYPDLTAIYNAGGATMGIAKALKDHGRDQDVVLVAHEATAGNKALLLDGTLDAVIDQNPRVEVREALNILTHAARGISYHMVPPRLQIVFRENLPSE